MKRLLNTAIVLGMMFSTIGSPVNALASEQTQDNYETSIIDESNIRFVYDDGTYDVVTRVDDYKTIIQSSTGEISEITKDRETGNIYVDGELFLEVTTSSNSNLSSSKNFTTAEYWKTVGTQYTSTYFYVGRASYMTGVLATLFGLNVPTTLLLGMVTYVGSYLASDSTVYIKIEVQSKNGAIAGPFRRVYSFYRYSNYTGFIRSYIDTTMVLD